MTEEDQVCYDAVCRWLDVNGHFITYESYPTHCSYIARVMEAKGELYKEIDLDRYGKTRWVFKRVKKAESLPEKELV